MLCDAKVTEVTEETIAYEQAGETHVIEGADTLVLALGYRPDPALANALAEQGATLHVIGDADKPGNIKDAMEAAYTLAREL